MPPITRCRAALVEGAGTRSQHGLPAQEPADIGWTMTGRRGDPCIVLLHGVFFGRRSWRLQVDALAAQHRVLVIDLPGHGDLRDVQFTLPGAARWVTEVLDRAAVGSAVVVGWSLGGFVALEVAATAPDRVAGLVLTGASMEPRRFLRGPGRIAVRILGNAPSGVSTWVAMAIIRLLWGSHAASILSSSDPTVPQGMRALARLPEDGFRRRLAGFKGPVLLLNGSKDRLVRAGQDDFLRTCPDGTARRIPGAGHLAPIESPRAFNEALTRFAERQQADRVPGPSGSPAREPAPGSAR